VLLQLDSYTEIKASVFQLARAPGEKIVYLGSALLVAGIFSMFFVRERRLWLWIKDAGPDGHSRVLMAMSTARRTLDFEKEYAQTRAALGAALGTPPLGGKGGAAQESESAAADAADPNQATHSD
jgi:cytochrome c biogenesis protein